MKVALFGNYVFAKTAAEKIFHKFELVCFCNDVCDDDKYGPGIQKYAMDNHLKCIIGDKKKHISYIEEFKPDYILSVSYKNIIPVEELPVRVYGIHLGGLYGSDAIRGKSSLVWYKLRNIKYAKVTLYQYTVNNIDVGDIVKEVSFPISPDDNININMQLECIEFLVDFMLQANFKISAIKKEFVPKKVGSYYPKAVKKICGACLSKKEIIQLEKAGIKNYDDKKLTEYEVNANEQIGKIYQYCMGEDSDNHVLFLHGFASTIPNDKIKKLACLSEGISVSVPLVKGINRIYCDGMNGYADIYLQLEALMDYFDLSKTIIVCSSISSLLLCEHLPRLFHVKAIIFVTPIFNLFDNAFDEKMKEAVWNGLNGENFEFSAPYYKGCRMSRVLLEKLKEIDLLEHMECLEEIKNRIYFIFAREDSHVQAEKWRDKCIEERIPLNNINIIDGNHSFADIQQLYYLACFIRKICR